MTPKLHIASSTRLPHTPSTIRHSLQDLFFQQPLTSIITLTLDDETIDNQAKLNYLSIQEQCFGFTFKNINYKMKLAMTLLFTQSLVSSIFRNIIMITYGRHTLYYLQIDFWLAIQNQKANLIRNALNQIGKRQKSHQTFFLLLLLFGFLYLQSSHPCQVFNF